MQTRMPLITRRGGVTLLEVLISIGVVFIGLMGAASLFPVASFQLKEGNKHERAALVGKRAVRELQLRGMANVRNWVVENPTLPWFEPAGGIIEVFRDQTRSIQDQYAILNTYCIDPRGVAAGLSNHFPGAPVLATNMPLTIPRITLRSEEFSQQVVTAAMALGQADQSFVIEDELDFEIPAPAVEPPVQSLLQSAGQNVALKRVAKGQFSWMAFFVPKLVTESLTANPDMRVRAATDLFDVWIVVLKQRVNPIPEEDANALFAPDQVGDILVTSGSEIEIGVQTGASTEGNAVLRAEPGEWIMLTEPTQHNPNPVPNGSFHQRLAWYRIIGAEDPRTEGGFLRRYITVSGPDWVDSGAVPTYAVHLNGVVAVYRKTIRVY